jgi:hypothetical protein
MKQNVSTRIRRVLTFATIKLYSFLKSISLLQHRKPVFCVTDNYEKLIMYSVHRINLDKIVEIETVTSQIVLQVVFSYKDIPENILACLTRRT